SASSFTTEAMRRRWSASGTISSNRATWCEDSRGLIPLLLKNDDPADPPVYLRAFFERRQQQYYDLMLSPPRRRDTGRKSTQNEGWNALHNGPPKPRHVAAQARRLQCPRHVFG